MPSTIAPRSSGSSSIQPMSWRWVRWHSMLRRFGSTKRRDVDAGGDFGVGAAELVSSSALPSASDASPAVVPPLPPSSLPHGSGMPRSVIAAISSTQRSRPKASS